MKLIILFGLAICNLNCQGSLVQSISKDTNKEDKLIFYHADWAEFVLIIVKKSPVLDTEIPLSCRNGKSNKRLINEDKGDTTFFYVSEHKLSFKERDILFKDSLIQFKGYRFVDLKEIDTGIISDKHRMSVTCFECILDTIYDSTFKLNFQGNHYETYFLENIECIFKSNERFFMSSYPIQNYYQIPLSIGYLLNVGLFTGLVSVSDEEGFFIDWSELSWNLVVL
ncbi:MAG: hypothetical protein KF882_08425 [Bacteroidia bacterium]|nr:hypothetical protein [Bacteroidia bacterium]MCO5253541.1 hypothetical protein [Bacteroidota bacterium]